MELPSRWSSSVCLIRLVGTGLGGSSPIGLLLGYPLTSEPWCCRCWGQRLQQRTSAECVRCIRRRTRRSGLIIFRRKTTASVADMIYHPSVGKMSFSRQFVSSSDSVSTTLVAGGVGQFMNSRESQTAASLPPWEQSHAGLSYVKK